MFGNSGVRFDITLSIHNKVNEFRNLLRKSDKLFNLGNEWEPVREKANVIEKEILKTLGYNENELDKVIILFPHSDEFITIREA